MKFENQNGLPEPKINHEYLHVRILQLSPDVQEKLLELQQKGIDINELILEFLNKRELEISEEKSNAGIRKEQSSKNTQKTIQKLFITHKDSQFQKIMIRDI